MGLVTGGIFIVLGVFVLCVATFGIFRFEYALNRIHVAAKCDTLGSMLILAGLIISNGWNMESAKIGLIYLDWQPGGLPHGGQGRGQEQSKP